MAEELPPPTVMKWACIVLDYLGLGFILIAPEEWVRLHSASEFINYLLIGAAFLFVGVMAPRLAPKVSGRVPRWALLLVGLALCGSLNYWLDNPVWKLFKTTWSLLASLQGKWFERLVGAGFLLALVVVILFAFGVFLRIKQHAATRSKGFLEHKLDAELALNKMPKIMTGMAQIMAEIGPSFERHTKALSSTSDTAEHLKISKKASSGLDSSTSRMKRIGAKYEKVGESFCSGLIGWSNWIETTRPGSVDPAFRAAMRELNERLATSSNQIHGYCETIVRMKGISSSLDAAAERHVAVVGSILAMTLKIKRACEHNLRVTEASA